MTGSLNGARTSPLAMSASTQRGMSERPEATSLCQYPIISTGGRGSLLTRLLTSNPSPMAQTP